MGCWTKDSCDTFRMLNKLPSDYVVSGAMTNDGFRTPKDKDSNYYYVNSIGTKDLWTDGTHLYASGGTAGQQHVLNGDVWEHKTWYCADGSQIVFNGSGVWSDGVNIYLGDGYVLNGDIWEPKTWNGELVSSGFGASGIWTDGVNIYYLSDGGREYILNGDTWEKHLLNFPGSKNHYRSYLWSDGTNIYYTADESYGGSLVRDGDAWKEKTWNIDIYLSHNTIWSDGTNIYYSSGSSHYILKGDTWEALDWDASFNGTYLITNGTNIYIAGSDGVTTILLPTKAALYENNGEEWYRVGSIR